MKTAVFSAVIALVCTAALSGVCRQVEAQDGGVALQLKPSQFKARQAPAIERESDPNEPAYELKYKLNAGLTYPSVVTQKLSVQTTINGVKEDTITDSVSDKSWRIESVNRAGAITLVHQVDAVKMLQRVTGKTQVSYNSRENSEIPTEYESLKGTLGVPLTEVEMNPFGRIATRKDLKPTANPGIGELTLSLPEEPIRVGDSWTVPDEVTLKIGATPTPIKLRHAYSLIKVSAGLATISFRTEVLSPIANDPKIMSQLVGRLQKGEIKFDIDEGRPISRMAEIETAIVGFAGENSSMRYDMRATEEFGEGMAIVARLPEPTPAGPAPSGARPSRLLPGVSTGPGESSPMPTPATPPPAQGEPTPADPPGKVTLSPVPGRLETSVLVIHKPIPY
jgi:hypothetical protein